MIVRHCHVRRRSRRSGITLLEVLISIGVLSVGVLGVASLLPLAKSYMAEGSKFDRAATLGNQAIHDLEVRTGFLDPQKWMAPAGNGLFQTVCPASPNGWPTGFSLSSPSDTYNYNWYGPYPASPVATIPAAPFILNPLACAFPSNLFLNSLATPPTGGTAGIASTNSSLFGSVFFPPSAFSLDGAGTPGSPALARISISGTTGTFLPFAFAEKIFRCTDDVLFQLPSDPAQRPFVQGSDPSTPAANLQQAAPVQGDYTWFAVIDNVQRPWNPGLDQGWGFAGYDDNNDGVVDDLGEAGWPYAPPPAPPYTPMPSANADLALWRTSGGELWKVWIVIVQKRNLALSEVQPGATPGTFSFTPPTGTMTYVPPERMVYCDFLTAPLPVPSAPWAPGVQVTMAAAGQGGGDVEIYLPNTLVSGINTTAQWLTVKPNQWIMMSAWPNLQSAPPANPTQPFTNPIRGQLAVVEWFRISSVGDIEPLVSGGTVVGWHRKLTLDGPDWNPYKFVDAVGASGVSPLPPLQFQSCYATIVDGVVGVYEATIEQGE